MNYKVISPSTSSELMEVIRQNQSGKFRFGAGYTDLLLELRKQPVDDLAIINLANLHDKEFTTIIKTENGIRLGSLVTISDIIKERQLTGRFPVLCKAATKLASRQIRKVATIGGNLCTASPAGDIACALAALEARCEILSDSGTTRTIPLNKFLVDVRKTDLQKNEVLRSVQVDFAGKGNKNYSDFLKIGTRRSMECAVVTLAYSIQVDKNDKITHAGIAIGSVAPTIKFVSSACKYLIGKKISSLSADESEEFASKVLEYASPISDIRASAWYRSEVLHNLSKAIFSQ